LKSFGVLSCAIAPPTLLVAAAVMGATSRRIDLAPRLFGRLPSGPHSDGERAVAVFPPLSLAEQVTRVLPSLKRLPERGVHFTGSAPSTSSLADTMNYHETQGAPRSETALLTHTASRWRHCRWE
jgi:hypothetical protein